MKINTWLRNILCHKSLIGLLLLLYQSSGAQIKPDQMRHLVIRGDDTEATKWTSKEMTDSAASAVISSIYNGKIRDGYLQARIDTVHRGDSILVVVDRGERYTLCALDIVGKLAGVDEINEQKNKKSSEFASAEWIALQIENRLKWLEDHGYPFANIVIEETGDSANCVFVRARMNSGPKVIIDSLEFISKSKLPKNFLSHYIGIKSGDVYNETNIASIPKRLSELGSVQVTGAPSVVFRKSGTEIRIKAERKKANSFNGVIGIRPQERTGKIVITGDAEIKLVNTFNSGDEIWVNWRRLQSQTQDLQLKVNAPYFGKIPFGAEGSMKIYRRDSTFSSFNGNIGILYQLGRGNTFRIFAEKSNSTGIGLATNATSLNLAGVRSTLYGVGLRYGKLDQKWNPRKGFYIDIDLSTGIRNIGLSQNDRPYNGIPDKKLWRVQGNIERYQPLWKKQTLRLAAIGGWYQTNPVFDNEMYRIGGLRTLRGISEETLFASSWVTGTMEYRFLFDENSAIYAFIDQNWYEKRGIQSLITDTPKGFGIGLNLSTGNGIFTFNYALGQQAGQELLIRNAKISFGFRNLF